MIQEITRKCASGYLALVVIPALHILDGWLIYKAFMAESPLGVFLAVLAFVIIIVLTLVMGAVLLLEFFNLLPAGAEMVALLSLAVFSVVLVRAILNRALSTPSAYGRQLSSRRVIGPPSS